MKLNLKTQTEGAVYGLWVWILIGYVCGAIATLVGGASDRASSSLLRESGLIGQAIAFGVLVLFSNLVATILHRRGVEAFPPIRWPHVLGWIAIVFLLPLILFALPLEPAILYYWVGVNVLALGSLLWKTVAQPILKPKR